MSEPIRCSADISEKIAILDELKSILYKKPSSFVFESCLKDLNRPYYTKHEITKFKNSSLSPDIGPSTYNNDMNTIDHNLRSKHLSTHGYVLGARTEKRMREANKKSFIAPGHFQDYIVQPKTFTPAYKPFGICSIRDAMKLKFDIPPVGHYSPEKSNPGCTPHVTWQYDLMRRPINLPSITQKSTIPINTNKLASTLEERRYNRKLAYLKLFYPCHAKSSDHVSYPVANASKD